MAAGGAGDGRGPYSSGERVFGPPRGTFDVEWAARALQERRPGTPFDAAWSLAERAWEALRATGRPDPGAVARALADDGVPRAEADDAARVAVDLALAYDVDLDG